MFDGLFPTGFTFDPTNFFVGFLSGVISGMFLHAVVFKNKDFRFIFHWGERNKIEVETSSGPNAISGGEQEDL